jgi:tRNA(adenine34) deaminase
MALALREARRALKECEVPVGAVVVRDGEVIARGHNQPVRRNDPAAHAEILALRRAGKKLGNYRLGGCTLYVTIEPCAMCAGALVLARVSRLVYGARDPKAGACGSALDVVNHAALNHKMQVVGGVLEPECASLLKQFFRERRSK